MPKSVKLDGHPLVAGENISWPMVPGVEPTIQEFSFTEESADALLSIGGPLTLEIVTEDGKTQKIEHLWALSLAPQNNPAIRKVRVADRRWFWKYAWVGPKRYNMRRRVGTYRIEAWDIEQLQRVEDNVQYAAYSVVNGVHPYTLTEILEDVLKAVLETEKELTNKPVEYEIDKFISSEIEQSAKVENLEIDNRGDTALALALQQLPASAVIPHADGKIVIYSKADELYKLQIEHLKKDGIIIANEWMTDIEYRNEAPFQIKVLFTIEAEVRFDFIQESDQDSIIPDDTARRLNNVLPVPDYQVTIGDETIPQNTYVDFLDYLPAIEDTGTLHGTQITDFTIRRTMLPWMDLWASLAQRSKLDPDADWSARISAIERHWRRTYRIYQKWLDNIYAIKDYTVGTVNQALGGRAPAWAFADYLVLSSNKAWAHNYAECGDANRLTWGTNVYAWSENIDKNTKPSAASVKVVDSDQGIIAIEYLLDYYKNEQKILPGTIGASTLAGWCNPGRREAPIANNVLKHPSTANPTLEEDYKASVIVTCIPAAPNSKGQLFEVSVEPPDMSDYPVAEAVAKLARGPLQHVRVPAQVETARIRWLDADKEVTEWLFGLNSGIAEGTARQKLRNNCVNIRSSPKIGPGGASLGASLENIARAVAARIWASYAPHSVGAMTGNMDTKEVHPESWIERVVHSVGVDGRATTRLEMPRRYPELDWTAILDQATRTTVLRQVDHKRS